MPRTRSVVSRIALACSLALCVACASAPESPAERAALEAAKSGATACGDAIPEALAEGHVRIRPGQNLCLKLEIDVRSSGTELVLPI